MKRYVVTIGLRNGQIHKFRQWAEAEKVLISSITTDSEQEPWYYFMESHVRTQVLKKEIVSVGIALTRKQILEYNEQQSELINKYDDEV